MVVTSCFLARRSQRVSPSRRLHPAAYALRLLATLRLSVERAARLPPVAKVGLWHIRDSQHEASSLRSRSDRWPRCEAVLGIVARSTAGQPEEGSSPSRPSR